MRIVGGKYKGMNIEAPRGLLSRPPLALIRESVFNVLGGWVVGKSVLDLYAGSGSLGIEALSRGAGRLCSVDSARRCVDMVKRNLAGLGASEVSTVSRGKALDFIRSWQGPGFDLVFVDPPFLSGDVQDVLACLASESVLSNDAIVVSRHHRREDVAVPGAFELFKQRKFGESMVLFLRRASSGDRL
jgi:16S rRNA (guanine966-N2)-methyltransferase